MALENYTRGQKIFMVTLVVLLAAMFTVTGAMLALVDQGGNTAPSDHGTLDGEQWRLLRFQQKRRHLGIIQGLDFQASRSFGDDAPETIYARVPAMSPRPEFDTASQPFLTSLLSLWPQYQDQDVWCHIVLARRAAEAGVAKPSASYMGAVLTALMNEGASELDKFPQRDLKREFESRYSLSLEEFVPTLAEAMQIRDYVESLLADEKAKLTEISRIVVGNVSELKAQYMLLDIDPFMQQAREEVEREWFAQRASQLAGGGGVASLHPGYNRIEEAYDKNSTHLQAHATFRFDVFRAYPEELVTERKVDIEEGKAMLVYEAVKDDVYTVEAYKPEGTLDERVEQARIDFYNANAARLELDKWTTEQWDAWKAEKRKEMEKYATFDEVLPDLNRALRETESLRAAQTAMARLMNYLERRKSERERRLDAELEVIRKERAVWEGARNYLNDLRAKFDTVETQAYSSLRAIESRLVAMTDGANNSRQLESIVTEFTSALSVLDTSHLESLVTAATLTQHRIEQTLKDKEAALAEFNAKETHTADDGTEMTPEEIEARRRQLELEIDSHKKRLELRDLKLPMVEEYVEAARRQLAEYELHVRSAMHGDESLRRSVLRELLVVVPTELGAGVRAARDRIAPTEEADEYEGQVQLISANLTARENSKRKDAANTLNDNIANWIAQQELAVKVDTLLTVHTWESLLDDPAWAWMEHVDGARQFLEEPTSFEGSTSSILRRPGVGYLVLRLREKTPKHAQGKLDAKERLTTLAAMRRARELCVEAMEKIRADVLENGWDSAYAAAKQKYGDALHLDDTVWFKENEDIPRIYSHGDTEVLNVTSSPSATSPDAPFVQALKDITLKEGVTKIVPHKFNNDALRRPDHDKWGYMLARVTDRRAVPQRMSEEDFKDGSPWGGNPADLWRNRHLAASDTVRDLIEPARVLAGHEIIQYKSGDQDKSTDETEETKE